MNSIATRVATESGGKYVRQLCKHWSHKLQTEVDGDTGTVTFPSAVAVMAADEGGIAITITGEKREDVEGLTDVVARHIDRFAFREAPLAYDWQWQEA
ncbi:DUF2218 domain-containing protein [Novosphingobium aerophilum]|uniref:DUF2218 domain-containing protein n=1 Tax=Novosphingobium TaxID=165696 RepID=UPI0006C83854|nr:MULTISPECIES: DUF2218 domain-containing protein [unclassified Novosphingobium]KPH58761.1 hypothetical protein ADT71_26015 [Novosphingobium sp. ST904]MPS70735.1 DUF2218 domain-containing protein [Novosphingobium sp.]TCM42272.1 hypothetical protein EDF59_102236 [Novosphingobium sp. ST904]WRT91539.1 DUF2218 domain-containing protein [Novosphingobium sp. RL4]